MTDQAHPDPIVAAIDERDELAAQLEHAIAQRDKLAHALGGLMATEVTEADWEFARAALKELDDD